MSCVIVAGDFKPGEPDSAVELLTGQLGTKRLPNLPKSIIWLSLVMHSNGTILLCGGRRHSKTCFQLDHDCTWKEHSTLNQGRHGNNLATSTPTATFIFGGFGGIDTAETYEYLPKDSKTWLMGKNEIPGGFERGPAIAVRSDQEIWLIGGHRSNKRILSFSVKDHTFREMPYQLNVGRGDHTCAFIPNTKKIMIAGGREDGVTFLDTTEILDTEDGSISMASPLNFKRADHGMGVLTIDGEDRLAVFGGESVGRTILDSVEVYNAKTGKWDVVSAKLNQPNFLFGYLSVKLSDIISKL